MFDLNLQDKQPLNYFNFETHSVDTSQDQSDIYVQNTFRIKQDRDTFQIDHTLDQSSLEHDDFLEEVKLQMAATPNYVEHPQNNQIFISRESIRLELIQGQTSNQSIDFTNPYNSPLKLRLQQCSFEVKLKKTNGSCQSLSMIGNSIQFTLEAWSGAQLIFSIQSLAQEYGDIIQNVIVTGEWSDRQSKLKPITIQFYVKYLSPKILVRCQGYSDILNVISNKMAVVKAKCGSKGDYHITLQLGQNINKLELSVEGKGCVMAFVQNITLTKQNKFDLRLRARGTSLQKQRGGLILKPLNSKIAYIIGFQFSF